MYQYIRCTQSMKPITPAANPPTNQLALPLTDTAASLSLSDDSESPLADGESAEPELEPEPEDEGDEGEVVSG